MLVAWFPKDKRIVVFVDPGWKTFGAELFDSLVVDVEISIPPIHVMWVVWVITTRLEHYSRVRDVFGDAVIFTQSLNDTLEIVIEDDVVSACCNCDIQLIGFDSFHHVVEECLRQVVLTVVVLKVNGYEDVVSFEERSDVCSFQYVYKFVAGIEVIVEVGSARCVATEAKTADILCIFLKCLAIVNGLIPGGVFKAALLGHHGQIQLEHPYAFFK